MKRKADEWCEHYILFPTQGAEPSHFVLIAGEPIKEPVVQHGASLNQTRFRNHKQNSINITWNVILPYAMSALQVHL